MHDGDETEWFSTAIEFALAVAGDEPQTVDEALGRADEAPQWLEAIETELSQIEKLKTWDIVEAPPGTNIVKCRYTFRYKRDAEGKIARYRACLVAKGYSQTYGVDYHETFAPVVKLATLCVLLSFAASKGSIIYQADVKNAYLNADIEDIVYMELPPHYARFRGETLKLHRELFPGKRLACKLNKPLYGTKQGAHDWYQKLRATFLLLEYKVLEADQAVFYKIDGDQYTIVAAATDDFTIVADTVENANMIKKQLNKHFEIVDLGDLSWLLGFHVTQNLEARTITIGQQAFIDQVVERMGLTNARTAVTPMEPGIDLTPGSPAVSPNRLTESEKSKYRQGIGSLMYLLLVSRPDIVFAVSTLSQHMEAPHETYWKGVLRVFRYLKGTRDICLTLGGTDITLTGYSDADWASHLHRHSISGFAFFIGNGPVTWSAKKQPIVTLSSTESEYVALTHAAKELIWLRKIISELFSNTSLSTTTLYCDNQGAILLSKDSTFHARTKHIDTHFHFIRQTVESKQCTIKYIPTDEMIADLFTKSLGRSKLERFRALLGLEIPPSA